MPWQEKARVELRTEFVVQASQPGANVSALCRRYHISRKTGYKWLQRHQEGAGLTDQSRRPHHSPGEMADVWVEKILSLRQRHPYWGARKIHAILARQTPTPVPAKSAIHNVLKKQGYVHDEKASNHHWQRFEHDAPNHLWQMDFKGHFAYEKGRCYPLTILDDHSRFSISLRACLNEQGQTVQPILIETFRRYGLPQRMNVDNGNPWGSLYACARYTTLSVWLIRLGILVSYSRPRHPQTNGKDERFHRTLKLEVLQNTYFKDLEHIQQTFDNWRNIYNLERPHEGIHMQVPATRYHPSYRAYPEKLADVEYSDDHRVLRVDSRGRLAMAGRSIFVGMPFAKETVGIRQQASSENIDIYYCHQKLGQIDLADLPKKTLTNLYSGKMMEVS